MSHGRREFVGAAGLAALGAGIAAAAEKKRRPPIIKPPRLAPGDAVGLVNPASATFLRADLELVEESIRALGLVPRRGAHVLDRYGYLAGRDADRAADVNAFFADREVKAVLAVRGGWGCARILPHVDYDLARKNPKVLMGYSDVTALLLAVHARTGLVTFHGPVGTSSWTSFSVDNVRRVVFAAEAVPMANPVAEDEDSLVPTEHRFRTITPGRARGRLVGGNLTVLSHILGSPFVPDWEGTILFLEDVDEEIYRVDRMLTHLKLAGVLDGIRGFVFGACTDCDPGGGYGSLTLEEVFDDHVKPLGIPAYSDAAIGHISKQFTVPIGVEAEMDAERGTIQLLEPAVI
jgi:muramoyltetrapeptide carboxypeptidase